MKNENERTSAQNQAGRTDKQNQNQNQQREKQNPGQNQGGANQRNPDQNR